MYISGLWRELFKPGHDPHLPGKRLDHLTQRYRAALPQIDDLKNRIRVVHIVKRAPDSLQDVIDVGVVPL